MSSEERYYQAHDQDIRKALKSGMVTLDDIFSNGSSAAEAFSHPRTVLTSTLPFINLSNKVEFDLAFWIRDITSTTGSAAIYGKPARIFSNDENVACAFIQGLEKQTSLMTDSAILINMQNVDIGVDFASMIAVQLSRISLEKDMSSVPIFINPEGGTKSLLHVILKENAGTAIVMENLIYQNEVTCWYIGKVEGPWKPVLEKLHQLGQAYSPQLAAELGLTDKDVAARLSILASRKLVARKWDKNAPGRGAYMYSPIVAPHAMEHQQISFGYFAPPKKRESLPNLQEL